jgi:hypothetical protein
LLTSDNLSIENNAISLSEESDGIRVKSKNESVILQNQSVDAVKYLIITNFGVVRNFYKIKAKDTGEDHLWDDINEVSISIVLHYLYMYNSWRIIYKKQENKELRFHTKDFENPSTHDIIFSYFKSRRPDNWMEISATLLGMGLEKLKEYYANRELFYNKGAAKK